MRIFAVILLNYFALIANGQNTILRCESGTSIFGSSNQYSPLNKSTILNQQNSIKLYPIPVVFHFIINELQLNDIGGINGIQERVFHQLNAINEDINGLNIDTNKIPNIFKKYRGALAVKFALALKDPFGKPTNGFDLRITEKTGFSFSSDIGSGLAYSNVKYSSAFGIDAWDVNTYLNIWVININSPEYYAMTIPPTYINEKTMIPENEMGIVLKYNSVGVRQHSNDYYIYDHDRGRILTHEIGHFFGLRHLWGDDDGLCPNSGGTDDGIDDTPPQADAISGCHEFPYLDYCSTDDAGLMVSNFMQYTNDDCRNMFTKMQCELMQKNFNIGNSLYSLTQHPNITDTTDSFSFEASVYPNPTNRYISIIFPNVPKDLLYIKLISPDGKQLEDINVEKQTSYFLFDLNKHQSGVFIVKFGFENYITYKKIIYVKE